VNPNLADQFKVETIKSQDALNNLGDPTQYKILVAEDSPLIRKLIQDVLMSGGFANFEVVGHGKAAWDRLAEDGEDFDILLTDIEMPKMDGLTLTRRVKEDEKLSHIPVIVFSSVMAEDIKRKAQSIGADAQVTKPEMENLLEKVIELLGKTPKAAAQLASL
jgi:two-component system chemotaxis response regulator CheV